MRRQKFSFGKHKRLLICITIAAALLIPLCSAFAAGTFDFGSLFRSVNGSETYSAYKVEVERTAAPPVTATIVVIHTDSATGNEIGARETYTLSPGSYGPYSPSAPTGYTYAGLAPGSDPVSGTIAAGETKTIIFQYTAQPATYPIYVYYYKDTISDANILGMVTFPSASLGTMITGVDLTLFAPSGYTAPGTRSGATVVTAGNNIVYVLYTKSLPVTYPIYVLYFKDAVDGELLGTDYFETTRTLGAGITDLVDATKYAPMGYPVPGTISGDTVVKSPYAIVYVTYTQQQYTVTYLPGSGGYGGSVDSVAANSQYTVKTSTAADVHKDWSNFSHWNTSPDDSGMTYMPGQVITVTGNLTLYAIWDAVVYSVTYEPNGGVGATVMVQVAAGSYYTLSDQGYTRNYYYFNGWNTRADGLGTNYSNGQVIQITGNLILYAKWITIL